MPIDVVNLWWDLRISIVLFTPYIPRLLTATCEIAEETFVMFKLSFMAVNQIVMRASTMQIFPAVK